MITPNMSLREIAEYIAASYFEVGGNVRELSEVILAALTVAEERGIGRGLRMYNELVKQSNREAARNPS
jgi:hypothetical protein